MTIEPAKLKVSHSDPKLRSQRAAGRAIGKVLADAAANGWSMDKTNSEMELVLKDLRLSYIEGVSRKTKAGQFAISLPTMQAEPAIPRPRVDRSGREYRYQPVQPRRDDFRGRLNHD